MSKPSGLIKSSLAKKYWMAATGLFLCLFLVGHLAGNLQLLIGDVEVAKDQFNLYAKFMTTNPAVKILSYVTYISILFHIIDGIVLTINNRKARQTAYAYNKPSANSAWNTRFMGFLGTMVLIFLVLHLNAFWAKMHWGPIETYMYEGEELKDLYTLTVGAFQDGTQGLIMCLVYVVSMIFLAFHLTHGFKSAFQSLGLNHPKYNPIIKKVGMAFGIIIPALFALIPLWVRFML